MCRFFKPIEKLEWTLIQVLETISSKKKEEIEKVENNSLLPNPCDFEFYDGLFSLFIYFDV
jgi:hypothetical protein